MRNWRTLLRNTTPTHKLDEEHEKGLSGNAALLTRIMEREHFALAVGDEAYDILIARVLSPSSGWLDRTLPPNSQGARVKEL